MSLSVYHDNKKMLAVNLRNNEPNNVGIKPDIEGFAVQRSPYMSG